jgi:hypothetical protein
MLLINQYIESAILTQKMFILTTTRSVANYERLSDWFNCTDNLKSQSHSGAKKRESLEMIFLTGF